MNIDRFDDRLREYALLMRLHRPIGVYLLLWPTLWSLFIASRGRPSLTHLVIFCLGTFLMRSAGCGDGALAAAGVRTAVSMRSPCGQMPSV